jgi:protein tyrosine/serine phosphatase
VDDPANQPVYVHCVGGRHRTGVMTAIYRMIDDKWTPDRAFQEMKSYKYGRRLPAPRVQEVRARVQAGVARRTGSAGELCGQVSVSVGLT